MKLSRIGLLTGFIALLIAAIGCAGGPPPSIASQEKEAMALVKQWMRTSGEGASCARAAATSSAYWYATPSSRGEMKWSVHLDWSVRMGPDSISKGAMWFVDLKKKKVTPTYVVPGLMDC